MFVYCNPISVFAVISEGTRAYINIHQMRREEREEVNIKKERMVVFSAERGLISIRKPREWDIN